MGIDIKVKLQPGGRGVPPPYEEAYLREQLMGHDIDGDGCLSKDELRKAFKSLGSRAPRIRAFLALFSSDLNHNGRIEGEEELELLIRYAKSHGYSVKSNDQRTSYHSN